MNQQKYIEGATKAINVLNSKYSWLEKYMADTLESMSHFDKSTPEYAGFFYEFCSAQEVYLNYVNELDGCYEFMNKRNILN